MRKENEVINPQFCPDCGVGLVTARARPFLKLYYGQLFTIPNATCYVCDVCNYSEFDETVFDLISDMIFHSSKKSTRQSSDSYHRQSPDDELTNQGQMPPV